MNKVMLTGRISTNLELFATTTGKSFCDFSIATNRPVVRDGEKVTDFIRCKVWNKLAENLVKYQSKGNLIGVIGRMQVDNYTDANGNSKYITYVLVEDIEFLERKKTTDAAPVENNSIESDPFKEFGEQIEIDDSELPF